MEQNELLKEYARILGSCYAQGQFEKLYPCLADDVVMESQWVPEPNKGKMNVMDYFTGKGKTLRDRDCCPSTALVRLIGNTNPVKSSQVILNGETQPGPASIGIWYEDGKYAMFMSQELEDKTNGALVDLKLNEDGKISRIDLCMPELFRFEIEEELDEDTEIAEDLLEMPDEAIETWIHHLLENNPDDFDAIDDFAEAFEDMYGDDMDDFIFREAIRSGAYNYVQDKADQFDLNDGDGYSTYLYETDDDEMKSILMDYGAFKSWEDYDDCRFARETVEGTILAFDADFQKEAYQKYLENLGITEEKLLEIMSNDYDEDEDPDYPSDFDPEELEALGVTVKDGQITFEYMVGEGGSYTQDVLESLGWSCDFEGDSWKLETIGVYFIK